MILGTIQQHLRRIECALGLENPADYCPHFNDPGTCLVSKCREKRKKDKPKKRKGSKR